MLSLKKINPSAEITCALLKKNIRVALNDYFKYTDDFTIFDNVSEAFVNRLAEDATVSKRDLRNLLRKSPAWDENLQAVVINGTRTHNPDYNMIYELAYEIIRPVISSSDDQKRQLIHAAIRFFTRPNDDMTMYIEAIKTLAPKAYKNGKKKSRIFKALCDALGVTDNSTGSKFQKNFALLADELTAKKIDFKLFLSINPAHFLTMSNPKEDERGEMMVSCHSFNSTDYQYNNGCSGYARDDVTMIAFTVANPDDAETLNNRKTNRQLFMYKVGNGLLLQSRLYSSRSGESYGGMNGNQPESNLYRDLIQRELSCT